MAMNCKVCEAKDQQIKFLQQTINQLIENKKIETTQFVPTYVNDLGDLVSVTESSNEIEAPTE